MTSWVFIFACAAYVCHEHPSRAGDGRYYETKAECVVAAKAFAAKRLYPRIWEIACTERPRP